MQTVFFSKILKTHQKLHWFFWRSNKNFRDAGFFLGTNGNGKHANFLGPR